MTDRGLPKAKPAEQAAVAEVASPAWMLCLERAHDALRHAARLLESGAKPVIPLEPPAASLEQSFASLYDAYDGRADRLSSTRTALAELDGTSKELAPGAKLDAAIGFALEYLTAPQLWIQQRRPRSWLGNRVPDPVGVLG